MWRVLREVRRPKAVWVAGECSRYASVETVTRRKVWGGREVGGRKAGQTGGDSKAKSLFNGTGI